MTCLNSDSVFVDIAVYSFHFEDYTRGVTQYYNIGVLKYLDYVRIDYRMTILEQTTLRCFLDVSICM